MVTVDALTVLDGLSVSLESPAEFCPAALPFDPVDTSAVFTAVGADSVPDGEPGDDADAGEDADEDSLLPPEESVSAAATPWLALSAMPAPAATTHTPRNQRFALTVGM
ncbi:hypothetical protein [Mycobacterium sp. NPDC006124]|uniref:hypothetical protein n=1 Tax=Mycobacterium sp. NPDC006124 TaxID=3156729 RepID=UPI0033AAE094